MSDKNSSYKLPPTTQANYIPHYMLNMPYTPAGRGQSSSNEDISQSRPNVYAPVHFPYNNAVCSSMRNYLGGTALPAQMNHNENCNRNRAFSLPNGEGLPMCNVLPPSAHLPLCVLPTLQQQDRSAYIKTRCKSTADVLTEPTVISNYPAHSYFTMLHPVHKHPIFPSTYLPHLPHHQRRQSTHYDYSTLPPGCIPPPSDDNNDDVFICESKTQPSFIRPRRKRTHTVDIPPQDGATKQQTVELKKAKDREPVVTSLSATANPSVSHRKEVPTTSVQKLPGVKTTNTPPKRVAFKDTEHVKADSSTTEAASLIDDDIFLSTLQSDRLIERDYDIIKADPDSFTIHNKIGNFLIGPSMEASPVKSIRQYLVRKEYSYQYYMAKILVINGQSADELSGRMLLHSEFTMLSLVQDNPGVVHHNGLYKDTAYDAKSGLFSPRLCLLLDCVTPHDFDDTSRRYLNLQQHVIKEKQLGEQETILLFRSIVSVVDSLHQTNIVHRDLKLGNMILNRETNRVLLTNFCLGRHLKHNKELLKDKRGSPAYISPDVLSGKPYNGKCSDMWSLGVLLFTMLYGQFPFYDQDPKRLFQKIQKGDYVIPNSNRISSGINNIIRGLLVLDPLQRFTSADALCSLQTCYATLHINHLSSTANAQIVPGLSPESKSSDEEEEDEEYIQKYKLESQTRCFNKRLNSAEDNTFGGVFPDKSRPLNSLPVIRHITSDARPLTMHDICIHRQIVNNTNIHRS